jgi:hypothetical protein
MHHPELADPGKGSLDHLTQLVGPRPWVDAFGQRDDHVWRLPVSLTYRRQRLAEH